MHRRFVLLAALLVVCGMVGWGAWTAPVHAQLESLTGKLGGKSVADSQDLAKLSLKASIEPAAGNQPAKLVIVGQIAQGWHTYSTTQSAGGPIRTKIKLPSSSDYRLLGDFTPSPAPAAHEYPDVWPGLKIEEHTGQVTWQAPIELSAGVDPAKLEIAGSVYAQLCAESCLPPRDYKFVAKLAAGSATTAAGRAVLTSQTGPASNAPANPAAPQTAPAGTGEALAAAQVIRAAHASIQGRIEPSVVAPGGRAVLVLSAEPAAPWYIYALADHDPDEPGNPKPTLIELESNSAFSFGRPTPSAEPASKMFDSHLIRYYSQPVSWTVPITVPADARPGDYPIVGLIGFMTCKDGSCDLPSAARFSGSLRVAEGSQAPIALAFTPAKYDQVRQLGAARLSLAMAPGGNPAAAHEAALPQFEIIELNGSRANSLPMILLFSFLGGLILNVMPCVLPVIGLKILSFVEQAGHSHARILFLNLIYSAGML
ncbi:MAG TPA: protein-disulfide reductase DsbD domain-containing protein, partial [Pirellulales bacterium]|nr:protein-disulfide reductase DsbD domain-containing protein [Pirellulales bacterium]